MYETRFFPVRILCFDHKSTSIAARFGWLPGARYQEFRHVRHNRAVGLIDVNWRKYDFARHLTAVRHKRPLLTVVRDIERRSQVGAVLDQAQILAKYVPFIVVVPKVGGVVEPFADKLGSALVLGYSVPTKYGRTSVPIREFLGQPVHLLGGRPDAQRHLAEKLQVISIDSNRLTLDARYGDSFDGEIFRPNEKGGLYNCIKDSIRNINRLWLSYKPKVSALSRLKVNRWLDRHHLRNRARERS